MTTESNEAGQVYDSEFADPGIPYHSKLITVVELREGEYNVILYNNKKIGEMEKASDGYYVYYPEHDGGFWESEALKEIAAALDQLNEAWHKEVMEGCL